MKLIAEITTTDGVDVAKYYTDTDGDHSFEIHAQESGEVDRLNDPSRVSKEKIRKDVEEFLKSVNDPHAGEALYVHLK